MSKIIQNFITLTVFLTVLLSFGQVRAAEENVVNDYASVKAGVQMYFREHGPKTTYQEWKDRIASARKNGQVKQFPSGIEKFDFGNMQGILLPMDKSPTANGEPVFFSCTKWRERRGTKVGGDCSTMYKYKKNLDIWYSQPEWTFDGNGDYLFDKDKTLRLSVDVYLDEHPEYYYNRIERGE